MKTVFISLLLIVIMVSVVTSQTGVKTTLPKSNTASTKKVVIFTDKVVKTDEQWRKLLTPESFQVTRNAGTERAFTGAYWNNHEKGLYSCICCGQPLFLSDTKFESGTGWPSFYQAIDKRSVIENKDNTYGMERTEVLCSRCNAHLGHVFDDGPAPTHLRYCMNSVSLKFEKGNFSLK